MYWGLSAKFYNPNFLIVYCKTVESYANFVTIPVYKLVTLSMVKPSHGDHPSGCSTPLLN